jgi:adenine-specific DNA-methyltransferase
VNDLSQADVWRRELGYLPVPLFGVASERSYVMLNGGKGNFCLDVDDGLADPSIAAQHAWSADVDHYLSVRGETLSLLRWDQSAVDWAEHYKVSDVASKLEVFQRYIESRQAPRERSVVSRAVSVYRAVRARGHENGDRDAMLAFMAVLNAAWSRQDDKSKLTEHWPEASEAGDAAQSLLGSVGIDMIMDQLLRPDLTNRKPPSIPLMIRHASGRIFQEAHYLALAPIQTDLFFQGQVKVVGPASKALGAFFTPTPLVRTLAEQTLCRVDLKSKHIHVFDPACGSGEFLREAVRHLALRDYKGRVTITGYDISAPACLMARFGLAAEAATFSGSLTINIEHRDALNGDGWVKDVDVCLMNPPFVAWVDMTVYQRETVSRVLDETHAKRPDMASAFVRLAVSSLSPSAVIGTVLPASFLDGSSSAPLREFLLQSATVELSARLGNQAVFSDVTVDPALLILKRRMSLPVADPTLLMWADHATGSSDQALRALRRHEVPRLPMCLEDQRNFSIYCVPSLQSAKDWAPRPYASAKALSAMTGNVLVGARFSVQQGTITGLNAAFLVDNADYHALPKHEQQFFRPAIVNETIKNGQIVPGMWVFYPYGESVPTITSEADLKRKLPVYFQTRLNPYKEALIQRARITEAGWWRLSEHRSWQVARRPKIVSTYFGLAGSFALDRVGDLVVVQGYGWQPKREGLTEQHLVAIVATLNAPITNTLLAGVSNNLSGGQWNLSKRFVERMPLVDAQKLPDSLLESLSHIGDQMAKGEPWDPVALDRLARSAFGLAMQSS